VRIPSLKIGRGQHNDFVLRNDSISGNHCVLNSNRDGQWSVTDLNSGNGVVLNGESVQQAELRHGDTIELGELKMRFLLRA
jgi:pSer/pThr/pTyr-binding forkhead associated (FHA) protein